MRYNVNVCTSYVEWACAVRVIFRREGGNRDDGRKEKKGMERKKKNRTLHMRMPSSLRKKLNQLDGTRGAEANLHGTPTYLGR